MLLDEELLDNSCLLQLRRRLPTGFFQKIDGLNISGTTCQRVICMQHRQMQELLRDPAEVQIEKVESPKRSRVPRVGYVPYPVGAQPWL